MKRKIRPESSLGKQMKKKVSKPVEKRKPYDGDMSNITHTGSTLLDLAISGGRIHGGGIPSGILVEIFGPSGSGKTVILSELAGMIQRKGGEVMFADPEARLNKQFARIFDLDTDEMSYDTPDTVIQVFEAVRAWEPTKKGIHGIFADSLAALSTDMEMEDEDKMGMKRAKDFSEQLRKTCRILSQKKYLMVCSNQIRQTMNQFGPKYKSPGGEAVPFYASLRLRTEISKKIWETRKIAGKEIKRVIGIQIVIEVFKSSVWKPFGTAPMTILFDYGIDDIRANLQYIKDFTKNTVYTHNKEKLSASMIESIQIIEEQGWEMTLREEVIELWENIESLFELERKKKVR